MAGSSGSIAVHVETGNKRTFAGALDWPGWCRSARDEATALQALFDYGPRYARVLRTARLGFRAPADPSALVVVERVKGGSGTDFGVPGAALPGDKRPVDDGELKRFSAVLRACWRAFDTAVEAARGKELRTGPRGGGRSLERMATHVLEADSAYLGQLARKFKPGAGASQAETLARVRKEMLSALAAAAHGEVPERGPRGGTYWTARFFARYVAWHELDHAWEIEDRVL